MEIINSMKDLITLTNPLSSSPPVFDFSDVLENSGVDLQAIQANSFTLSATEDDSDASQYEFVIIPKGTTMVMPRTYVRSIGKNQIAGPFRECLNDTFQIASVFDLESSPQLPLIALIQGAKHQYLVDKFHEHKQEDVPALVEVVQRSHDGRDIEVAYEALFAMPHRDAAQGVFELVACSEDKPGIVTCRKALWKFISAFENSKIDDMNQMIFLAQLFDISKNVAAKIDEHDFWQGFAAFKILMSRGISKYYEQIKKLFFGLLRKLAKKDIDEILVGTFFRVIERHAFLYSELESQRDFMSIFLDWQKQGYSHQVMYCLLEHLLKCCRGCTNGPLLPFCLKQAREHPEYVIPVGPEDLASQLVMSRDFIRMMWKFYARADNPYYQDSEILALVRHVIRSQKVPIGPNVYGSQVEHMFEDAFDEPFEEAGR